ncbi:MAG: GNAT family N-acetyltransferase [Alphaproteobacteria bacterium]|nr:GNAT family N-acetyltransferase [Alphaproteobacteria bacterium]
MKIVSDHRDDNPYRKPLVKNLVAYNDANGPPERWRFVGFYAVDDAGQLIGGTQGCFECDWLHITHLWVKDPKNGLGRQLMEAAETYAKEEKKTGVFLDTYAFQAKGFYEKQGYVVFGTIENAAGPHARYFLSKKF